MAQICEELTAIFSDIKFTREERKLDNLSLISYRLDLFFIRNFVTLFTLFFLICDHKRKKDK